MPRNSSGTYALPAGNPVVTNTLIQSTWANTTLSDVSTAMTDSLDRNGRGAMLAPLKNVDGTAVAPSMSFSSEGTLGIYRVSAGVLGFSAGGALVLSIAAAGLTFTNPIILPIGSAAAPSLTFVANTNTGLYSPTTNQVGVTTNGAQRLLIDATGNVTVATGTLTFTAGQQVTFAATGANLITASHAAGTLALQTGGANTRLSIDAAGVVTVAQTTVLTGAVGIGGANALGKLQVFGGAVVIDNNQNFSIKNSGGTASAVVTLDGSNNLQFGNSGAVVTQQFATSGAERMRIDSSGNVAINGTPSSIAKLQIGGALYVTGPSTLPAATGSGLFSLETTVLREYVGDGTGYARAFSKRTGSVTTDLVTITDTGYVLVGNNSSAWGTAGRGVIEINGSTNALLGLKVAGAQGGYLQHDGTLLNLVNNVNGGLQLGTNSAIRMVITAAGVIQDAAGNELGYKGLPQTIQGGAYTLAASDRGKHVYINAAVNVTVPASVFSTGDVITVVNGTGSSITLVQGSTSLYQAGTANTGNRSILVHGICTLLCTQGSSSSFFVSGNIT